MKFVELPIELNLQVNEPLRSLARTTTMRDDWRTKTFSPLGYAPLVVRGTTTPTAHWYSTEGGVVVGIGAQQSLEPSRTLQVSYPEILSPVVEAVAVPSDHQVAVPWELAHDFRKTHAEVATAARFLAELSTLVGLLTNTQQLREHSQDEFSLVMPDGLHVRPDVLQHLLGGLSLYEFPDAAVELYEYGVESDVLLFDTLYVSAESPFLTKLKGYVKWDPKLSASTIIAALALLFQIPAIPGSPTSPISCSVVEVSSNPSDQVVAASCQLYRADLHGDILAKQRYLFGLGYDVGPLDGISGPKTDRAMTEFCSRRKIVCSGLDSEVFIEALVSSMATRFPIVEHRKDA